MRQDYLSTRYLDQFISQKKCLFNDVGPMYKFLICGAKCITEHMEWMVGFLSHEMDPYTLSMLKIYAILPRCFGDETRQYLICWEKKKEKKERKKVGSQVCSSTLFRYKLQMKGAP